MPQNSTLFWLVFVAFCEIKVACGCWRFETKLLGWSELPNPGFCLKTLGFPADPANFSGFVG
jgi:hypothetical protein